MNGQTHRELVGFIWSICNLLRGPYKRNEYRKVILPLTVLRRFDCLLTPTKQAVLDKYPELKNKPETVTRNLLEQVTGYKFYNLSKMQFDSSAKNSLLNDPNNLAINLNSYINSYSPNVRSIMDKFKISEQIAHMAEKNILFEVIKAFCGPELSQIGEIDNTQMGYVFEELIRIGSEQANEEAGEHFTPREVIKLMVNLLLAPEKDLGKSNIVKTIYDPACGTGGMLSVAESYIHNLNSKAQPKLFGQDWNDEAWAVCKSDMLIKGEDADNIINEDTFTKDGFTLNSEGVKWAFDYMLANPPFGVEWKQQQKYIEHEADTLGYAGRFGAGLPRINDGALLFLQHMISKMRYPAKGGSRIGIVFNGSPLFTGDAGSGESNIRQWIIEKDWLEAIVAMPEQLFYNTGISTYIWVVTNRKEPEREKKIQLIDARNFWVQMEKSMGNKRRRIGDPSDKPKDPDQISEITCIYSAFKNGETRTFTIDGKAKELVVSKIFDNEDFGYHKITVERPLRLNFQSTPERLARLEDIPAFCNFSVSNKKDEYIREDEIEAGRKRQKVIRELLADFAAQHGNFVFKDRKNFLLGLNETCIKRRVALSTTEINMIQDALGERDETAAICMDKHGNPEYDPELRDTETIPLKEEIEAYFKREVLPHVPDAWIDNSKTKVGYEIPLNRHFYVYEPPRPLEAIEADIKGLETEILELLRDVTA